MKTWFKKYWAEIVRVVTLLMVGFLLVVTINGLLNSYRTLEKTKSLGEQNNQISLQNKELSEQLTKAVDDLKADNHKDHDILVRYNQCVINLFGSRPNQIITQTDLDACLAGTRIEPSVAPLEATPTPTPTETPKQSLSKRIKNLINRLKGKKDE